MTEHQIERLKREAKKLKRERDITHVEALNIVARREGFTCWEALARAKSDTSDTKES